MWLHVVLQGGVPLLALHAGLPLRLLGLLAVANTSLLTMIYFTHGVNGLCQCTRVWHSCQGGRASLLPSEAQPASLNATRFATPPMPALPHAGRMSLPAMRRLLPLLALQPVRCGCGQSMHSMASQSWRCAGMTCSCPATASALAALELALPCVPVQACCSHPGAPSQLARSVPMCQRLLQEAGADAPMHTLYQALAAAQ